MPTLNEKNNLEKIIPRIAKIKEVNFIVIVDDNFSVGPGYTFNGGTSFTAPEPEPIPDEIRIAFEAKEAAKASALAKLTALGLTEDEIKAIIGV